MSGAAVRQNIAVGKQQVEKSVSSYIAEAVRILAKEDQLRGRFITATALSNVIKKRHMFVDNLDFSIRDLPTLPYTQLTGQNTPTERLIVEKVTER